MSLIRQPRWIAGHLLVFALVVLFVRLGVWQLDRQAQHVERNARIEARLAEPPTPLMELLEQLGAEAGAASAPGLGVGSADAARGQDDALEESVGTGALEDRLAYRRVAVEGRFDPSAEVLLRSQTYRGQPGWHVLTPFVVGGAAGGLAVVVDRGWVPQGFDTPPVEEAEPPTGRIRLEGVLAPERDPPTGPLSRLAASDPEEGVLERIFLVDVDRLASQMPYALVPAYLIPTEGAPTATGELPVPPEPPAPETASHLAYAIQWFIFAGIGVVGYVFLLRQRVREHRAERSGDRPHGSAEGEPPA